MKQVQVVVCSLLAGFVGGFLGGRLAPGPRGAASVVRARTFELVDESGKAISIWGVNRQGQTLLAFLDGPESIPGENRPHAFGLDNPLEQRAIIGVAGVLPFLTFRGKDGKDRIYVGLDGWYKPAIAMSDANSLTLGG